MPGPHQFDNGLVNIGRQEELEWDGIRDSLVAPPSDIFIQDIREMSSYESVVGSKLKLKGKALDVKSGSIKKKKRYKHHYDDDSQGGVNEMPSGGSSGLSAEPAGELIEADKLGEENTRDCDDHLTPAERRYIEQRGKIDMHFMTKTANRSHRDRIQGFNQYLANLSEHYDIPKVGPG